jgi:hypothetical protein
MDTSPITILIQLRGVFMQQKGAVIRQFVEVLLVLLRGLTIA